MRRGKRKTKDEENAAQITIDEEEEMVDMVDHGNSSTVGLHCRLHTERRRDIEKRGKSSTFLLNSV